MKQHWPAPERNKGPILEVLRTVFTKPGTVVEVSSGTGQHAVHFATHLPHLRWQPTDRDPEHLASLAAWRAESGVDNLDEPLHLDVLEPWPVSSAVGVLNCNMVHIAPWACTPALFRGAASILAASRPLVMYGPYLRGADSAPSNLAFSENLKARDPSWGVRELDAVVAEAEVAGFRLERVVEMPANNLTVIYRR